MHQRMPRVFLSLAISLLGVSGVSCQHLPADEGERMEASAERRAIEEEDAESADAADSAEPINARERIHNATQFLEEDKLEAARREIAPLVREGRLPSEVNALLAEIEARRRTMEGRMSPESSSRLALDEVKAGLALPENYGQTVMIPPMDSDIELPAGPMEKLVNSSVSMDLEEADVAEIIDDLSRIENMNIIADQALAGAEGGAEAEEGGFPAEGGGGGGPTLTVKVRDVPLREVLSYISRNMGIAFHVGRNVIWVTQADGNTDNAPKLHTRIYKLRRGLIPGATSSGGDTGSGLGASSGGGDEYMDLDLEDALSYVLTDAEDPFRLFPKRNLLLARGTLEQLRRVEEILRDFDMRPKQVLIEARFVTISHADLRRLSFEWGPITVDDDDGNSASLQPRVSIGQQGSQSTEFSNAGSELSLAGMLGEVDFNVIIEAMRQTSSFRTLSAPRITVINNHEAEIKKGYTLRYWEEWEVRDSGIDAGDDSNVNADDLFAIEPVGSPQSENIGLSLKVKVNIGHDSETVFLSLNPASTQLDGFFNYGTGDDPEGLLDGGDSDSSRSYQLPKVTENSLATTVVAKSGQTVVLGGMIETREVTQERKVPFVGDIPLLGRFFRSDEDVSEPEHLLVFVTPRIINENGDFVRVDELSPAPSAGPNQ